MMGQGQPGRYNDYGGGFPNDFGLGPNGPQQQQQQQQPQQQHLPPQFHQKGPGPGAGMNVQQSFLDIKQELFYSSQNDFDLKRLQQQQQQQRGNAGNGQQNNPNPGGNTSNAPQQQQSTTTTLQMKQTQQLHISQQGGGAHGIQVSSYFFIYAPYRLIY